MSRVERSAAMTGEVDAVLRRHLLRHDGQEDICFALWHPSRGRKRQTALIFQVVLPKEGDRRVHGNASFNPQYLERAMALAASSGCGLALLHSHPLGLGWQGMSADDIRAEKNNAGAVLGATGQPLVGMTLAGDGTWSGRFWERNAPRNYVRKECGTVRVVGEALKMSYNSELAPAPSNDNEALFRTISSWGEKKQADLARMRVGVIGLGSVGGVIAPALARTGIEDILGMDFDRVEIRNLDRLQYALMRHVGELKTEVIAPHLAEVATAPNFRFEPIDGAVFEKDAFQAALDCDVIICCVDRPWGRYALNLIAYAHLIPVVDGGIAVRVNKFKELAGADWRSHTAMPGRICLECVGQYTSGLVQTEREGKLDDPAYIAGLPDGHPLKMRENVFGFSLACASNQLLQFLALTVAPLGMPNPGAGLYHFVGNITEKPSFAPCHPNCAFPNLVALGDDCGYDPTGERTDAHQPGDVSSSLFGRLLLKFTGLFRRHRG